MLGHLVLSCLWTPLLLVTTAHASLNLAPNKEKQHFWPHAHGRESSLSQTSYGLTTDNLKNLDAALAWKYVTPSNLSEFVLGTLIDEDKNIIVTANSGVQKFTPDGQLLWRRADVLSQPPILVDNAIYGMEAGDAVVYSLDLESGRTRWRRKVGLTTGIESDMVEGHNGVLVVAVDQESPIQPYGTGSLRTLGVNATNGATLWSYTPTCGLWNIMALFPDDESTIFMDLCGGLYRVNLFTGAEMWRSPGSAGSLTDGGSILSPDLQSIYTCSNAAGTRYTMNLERSFDVGRLRKFKVEDGSLVWEAKLANACMNFPGVSPDGETVVLADGTNVINPFMLTMRGKPRDEIEKEWALQQELLRNKTQATYYGSHNLDAALMGFDAHTGALKWKHDVEPWYGLAFKGDEERAYLMTQGRHPFGFCGPPHWGPPTIDQFGRIYIGRSNGELYIYDPADSSEIRHDVGDGFLLSGISFAPKMMVVPTCSWIYVFKF